MLRQAEALLTHHADAINALNVYPVPDGDTGTNMLLTLRAVLKGLEASRARRLDDVARVAARSAVLGARGNSGVLLSQYLVGLARSIEGHRRVDAAGLAAALADAAQAAYAALETPVEGTFLSVARAAGDAARTAVATDGGLLLVLEAAIQGAAEAVERTPSQLPVLAEAGVVDAGGLGLLRVLEGARLGLTGEELPPPPAAPAGEAPAMARLETFPEEGYGYCTEFLVAAQAEVNDLRRALAPHGDSLLVVGIPGLLRVHIHTLDPQAVLELAQGTGPLREVKVQDMTQQHRSLRARGQGETARVAVVAVAPGDGWCRLFLSLGASEVVTGGQSMNPSAEELVRAMETAPSDSVLVLPNNRNVILAAEQAARLVAKSVAVIQSRTAPQGVAALLGHNLEADLATNRRRMERALARVRTVEIARAVRDSRYRGLHVRRGQCIGLLDGELVSRADDLSLLVDEMLTRAGCEDADVVTFYYGEDLSLAAAHDLAERTRRRFPHLEVELLRGGQPHYLLIIAVE
ncbi:MAG: DAK2 domain-containing protein [Chloroflexi bacterium]|nr:DAK2 domain-containing protein [Chloroflexota bacterium]